MFKPKKLIDWKMFKPRSLRHPSKTFKKPQQQLLAKLLQIKLLHQSNLTPGVEITTGWLAKTDWRGRLASYNKTKFSFLANHKAELFFSIMEQGIIKNSVSKVPFSFFLLFHNHWITFYNVTLWRLNFTQLSPTVIQTR